MACWFLLLRAAASKALRANGFLKDGKSVDKKILLLIVIGILFLGLVVAIKFTVSAVASKQAIKALVEEEIRKREEKLSQLGRQIKDLSVEKAEFSQKEDMLAEKIRLFQDNIRSKTEREELLSKRVQALESEKEFLAQALSETNESLQKKLRISEEEAEQELARRKNEAIDAEMDAVIETTMLRKELQALSREKNELMRTTAKLTEELNFTRESIVREKQLEPTATAISDEKEQVLLTEELFKKHYNQGLEYDNIQDYDRALEEYGKALELISKDPDLHYNMAIIYDDYTDDKQKAVFHYQRYLELKPDAHDKTKVNTWLTRAKEELEWKNKLK